MCPTAYRIGLRRHITDATNTTHKVLEGNLNSARLGGIIS